MQSAAVATPLNTPVPAVMALLATLPPPLRAAVEAFFRRGRFREGWMLLSEVV